MTDFPRSLNFTPIAFSDIPDNFKNIIKIELTEINAFLSQLNISYSKNQNFLYAIKKVITFLLHRITNISFNSKSEIGFFEFPEKLYDSGYLIACLSKHIPFFMAMDDIEFPISSWMLMDINQKSIVIRIRATSYSAAKPLVDEFKKIKKIAKNTRNWTGKIYASVDVRVNI